MYDIAIIGAGPAGSTLARLIGKQYRVLLIDRRHMQGGKEITHAGKCCGGLLAPDAQQVMGEMGLGLPQSVLVSPQLFVVRTLDLEAGLERYYQRFYLNMDREAFDCWLLSLVPSSVDVRTNTMFRSAKPAGSGYEITLVHQGQEYKEQARLFVGADGANSAVRKTAFPQHQVLTYVAVQEWFQAAETLPYFTAIFDQRLTDFYAWTIPKEGYLLLGAALPVGKDSLDRFESLKQRLTDKGFSLGPSVRREGCLVLRPRSKSQIVHGEGKVVLLGEAAGWISPSSAEGFSYALRSARALAEALLAGLDGVASRYRDKTKNLAANVTMKNLKSPFMYHPMLRRAVLKTGVMSTDVRMQGSFTATSLLGE